MFTPEKFLEMAIEAETRYKELLKLYPPGTFNEERNEAYAMIEPALICAKWMQENGHQELRFVGPFGKYEFRNGDRVRVKSGSRFRSTAPKSGSEPEVLKRAQTVTIRGSVNRGYILDGKVFQPSITWAGTGGYWRTTDLNNVEFSESSVIEQQSNTQSEVTA